MRKFRFMTVVITMLTALMCLFSQETTAQNTNKIKVSGVVMDSSGEPLPGVGVLIKGTKTGSFTDVDGKFTISVSPDAVLEVSSMGYVTETVKVNGKTKLSIWLNSDSTVLDDVVVIGYGSVKKQDLTGSVTNVQMNDLKAAPARSVDNALQGRIAGADIMSTSGEPGATTTIRIRGSRSITASNEPLIVVDGVPMDNFTGADNNDIWNPSADMGNGLSDINPEDIESMSVLKGASAAALYGSRAGNGVILITTKSGRQTKGLGITVTGTVSAESIFMKPDVQTTYGQGTQGRS